MRRSRSGHSPDAAIEQVLWARGLLAVVVIAYIALYSYWTLRNHYGFATAGFDIGIYEQGVWLLSRFKEPFVTVLGLNLFGDHTNFFMLLFVPIYWVVPSAASLLVAQSVALGAAAIPAFLIAREKLRHEWLAVGVAVAYLIHPATGWTNFENFHPDSFEIPLILLAIYLMMKERWAWFLLCIVLLLSIKEDVPLLTFTLGLYVAIKHDRRIGLLTSALSVAYFFSAIWLILPAFNDVGTLDAWRIPTAEFGGTGGLLKAMFTRPWDVAAIALDDGKPLYLVQLFGGLAFLPLLGIPLALMAIGPLLSNLMSTFYYQYHIEYHYSTMILPVLVGAAVYGIARFRSFSVRASMIAIMVLASLMSAYLWGPHGRKAAFVADVTRPEANAIREAIELIPPDAVVSATHSYVPHLTHREQIYEFPVPWRAANWADFSMEGETLPFADEVEYLLVYEAQLEEEQNEDLVEEHLNDFVTIYRAEGILLLRRDSA